MMNASEFVDALRAAAPYVHAHVDKVFVLAFGGDICARTDFDRLLYDVALLQSLGVKPVIVHGARPQIEAGLAQRELPSIHHQQRRVTDAAALECVKQAAGALRMNIEAKLSTSLASTPMGGARIKVAGGNWVVAQPLGVQAGVDFGFTGTVRRVDATAIQQNLNEGRIALVSNVGYSPTGEIFNLSFEEVATAVATALAADKLIFVVASDPVHWALAADAGDSGQLSLLEASKILDSAPLNTSDSAHLSAAVAAAKGGVRRTHLIGADASGALLRELYTRDGVGLMLYTDAHYQAVRAASIEDVGGILELIKPLEDSGVLVPRSREQLELEIGQFDVMVRDGMVIACCALFLYPQHRMGEFSCVAVHPDYRGEGRAQALLKRAEASARQAGLQHLFALTTSTEHWFLEHGFIEARIEDLPVQKQRIYNYRRNSIVLIKAL